MTENKLLMALKGGGSLLSDPGDWTPEEQCAMAKDGGLIPPNRRVAYETRIECLRLAVQHMGGTASCEEVLRAANEFDRFTRGLEPTWMTSNDLD
jgi:hypothetical protein